MAEFDPYQRHRAAMRERQHTCTPYRLGLSVGWSGEDLKSPYELGSRGDKNYCDGLAWAKRSGSKPPQDWQAAFDGSLADESAESEDIARSLDQP